MNYKNILLIGKSGNGKSTLANVLINKGDCFEEVFPVGHKGISKTINLNSEEFTVKLGEWLEIDYRVIDTPGMGDNRFEEGEILKKIAELSKFAETGFYQILFVIGGRFNQEDVEIFDSLKEIFDEDVSKYTTIVQTKFHLFKKKKECEDNKKAYLESDEKIRKIIEESNGIVCVDNPPLTDDDEDEIKRVQKIYRESRKKILSHLSQIYVNYKPKDLVKLGEKLEEYLKEKEEIQKEIKNLKEAVKTNIEKEKQIREYEKKMAELEEKIKKQNENSPYWHGKVIQRLSQLWNWKK